MNTGCFAGHLGRDAELRTTPGGDNVCNFSIGVNVGFGDKKETLWVDAALWGKRAESLQPFLTKGKAVTVSGDVGVRTYQAKDGTTRAVLTLNAQRITLHGGGEQREAPPAAPAPAQRRPEPKQSQQQVDDDFDQQIPF